METPQNNHPHKHFSPVSFVAGLVIALTIFFVIYKLVQNPPVAQNNTLTAMDTIKTVLPIASIEKKYEIDFSNEHFYKAQHHKHIDQDAGIIIVPPDEMSALEKGNLSEQQKKILELLPNAPVIYIFDLKVTDYQNLYFSMGEPLLLENKMLAGQVLHDGMKDFSERKFKDCFTKMTLLTFANPNDVNALFYGGMSAYYTKDPVSALVRFEKVIPATNNSFKQEASWFKALALLDNNEKEKAKTVLRQIVDGKGFYTARAIEKLKQIG